MASRPKTLPAAAAPVMAGTGLAAHHGALAWGPAFAALLGAFLLQIGTNLANDYYDFVHGSDTHERVGPVRVTQAGLIPPATVKRGMVAVLGAAMLVGVYLVWVAGWPIVWIGLASVAAAVLYTGGPYPLGYHGLGEIFVFIFFGLVAVGGTYYVQALALSPDTWLLGVALGALVTDILVVNNLRDIDTDGRAGKHTMAVRLGRRGTLVEYLALLAVAIAAPVVGVLAFGWPAWSLAALLVTPLAVAPARKVAGFREARELLPALGETARVVALYGILLGLGLALG
jgi:1,4-dihydroxy-2-naphthoate octaprenyltransferase